MKKSVLKAFFALSFILYSIVSQAGPTDAVPKNATFLYLDAAQQGLGSALCGYEPLKQYMIPENVPVVLKVRISH